MTIAGRGHGIKERWFLFCFVRISRLYFLKFRFTERLHRKYREFPDMLSPPPHTKFPLLLTSCISGTFVTINEPILVHYY